MPTNKASARKKGAKTPNSAKDKGSEDSAELLAPSSQVSRATSYLEGLDERTLLSLSMDTPVRLTPPEDDPSVPDSSPSPLSKKRISNEVMAATLERLGFGAPNDFSNLLTLSSSTPSTAEVTMGVPHREEQVPTTEGTVPTVEAPRTDTLDTYGLINKLFQQVAQRTGRSVNTLILEWALLHAHTDEVNRTARRQVFEEEVDKMIRLVGDVSSFILLGC
jgi:hypothetical protein